MGCRGQPLKHLAEVRQAVVGQVIERAGATVENALEVIQHREHELIHFTHPMQLQLAGEVLQQRLV
ncbi:hypothetical protein D3C80_2134720 [compost metagenome]